MMTDYSDTMYDENEPEPAGTRDTVNGTEFYPGDAPPGKRNHYRRLARRNRGIVQTGSRRSDQSEKKRLDRLAVFDAIAGHLELTPYQKREAKPAMEDPPNHGYTTETFVVAVCAIQVGEDGRSWTSDGLFKKVISSINADTEHISRLVYRIKHGYTNISR